MYSIIIYRRKTAEFIQNIFLSCHIYDRTEANGIFVYLNIHLFGIKNKKNILSTLRLKPI